MNAGEQTLTWLYDEQLKIRDAWAIRTPRGFRWWADKNAQTIEVIGRETGPNGTIAYLISVRTDFLRNLDMTDCSLKAVNELLMSFSAMAGPVYDANSRTLTLCSLVRVHRDICSWMNSLISVASVTQIAEAAVMSHDVARVLGAEEAVSGHPERGVRTHPDPMADVVSGLIVPAGKQPCRWSPQDFQVAVKKYMQGPPSLSAQAEGLGCAVAYPCGKQVSLCHMRADQPHPRYGNGLFLIQSFPLKKISDTEGTGLALRLNMKELSVRPSGYGFGSFACREGGIYFTSFLPNVTYGEGLLPNLYLANANRAREMARHLAAYN